MADSIKAEMMRNLAPDERDSLIAAAENCIDGRQKFYERSARAGLARRRLTAIT